MAIDDHVRRLRGALDALPAFGETRAAMPAILCGDFNAEPDSDEIRFLCGLTALDDRIRQQFAAIPTERRIVVTSHDAFGYFGEAYGVTFLAPEGVATEAEPTATDVAAIIRQIRAVTGLERTRHPVVHELIGLRPLHRLHRISPQLAHGPEFGHGPSLPPGGAGRADRRGGTRPP